MAYKYELEKYNTIRSRYTCPACGHKHQFARYVDIDTGEYISDEVGKCNREDKCGYHYTPAQYFREHPENRREETTIKPGGNEKTKKPGEFSENPKNAPECVIPCEYINKSLGYGSSFIYFLCSVFDSGSLTSPTIERLMRQYYLGCTRGGAVIYWQIDTKKRVRTGKIMQYNPETGKRIKNNTGAIDWVHSRLKRNGILPASWELSQCLFGEHLLSERPTDIVCLVESEKTAIIGSGAMPEYVWLATGGKQNLKSDKCACLKGRDVIVCPDLGAFDLWSEKMREIANKCGFDARLSDFLENIASDKEKHEGYDIADYLIPELRKAGQQNNPKVTQRVNGTIAANSGMLSYLGNINPYIYDLIGELNIDTSLLSDYPVCSA